jgi:hypothetical protein
MNRRALPESGIALLAGALAAVLAAGPGIRVIVAHGEPAGFPSSVVTTQEKIDWLMTEADRAEQEVDAEANKPLAEQREAFYRATLERVTELIRLTDATTDTSPRLRARVGDVTTKARAGLERIANGKLHIGMSPEQVREVRGEPLRVSPVATATGVRQQWHYGMTVLSFDDGKLVEILLKLKSE